MRNVTPRIADLENQFIGSDKNPLSCREYLIHDLDLLNENFDIMKYRFFEPEEYVQWLADNGSIALRQVAIMQPQWLGDWYREMFVANPPVIKVGTTGGTIYYVTDHRACTVIRVEYSKRTLMGVPIPKEVEVEENETKTIDYYAGDYRVDPDRTNGHRLGIFTLRKSHRWVEKGCDMGAGLILNLGYREHYIDPSF